MTLEHSQHAARRNGFGDRVRQQVPAAGYAERIETVMLNVGMRCDTACAPCHHRCSPERTEVMSAETMWQSLELLSVVQPQLLDVTGGEPALWPLLPELISRALSVGVRRVRVRSNLTGLLSLEARGVAAHLAENRVEILASLPAADLAPGDPRLCSLLILRDLGYGDGSADWIPLDLAHTPSVTRAARPQREVEAEYRTAMAELGIKFRTLREITGVPVGRFGSSLAKQNAADAYLAQLRDRFNHAVLPLLDCRRSIDVAWDGTLWDCDFNLAARTPLADGPRDLGALLSEPGALVALSARRIAFASHCFACTADAGSG